MKALSAERRRVVLLYVVALVLMSACFVEEHMKVRGGVTLLTGAAAALFLLAGIWGRYNL
jgi:hypothetical protein